MAKAQFKVFDSDTMHLDVSVADEAALWNSTDVRLGASVDLKGDDLDVVQGGDIQIIVPGGFTSAGAATVLVTIQHSVDNSTWTTLLVYKVALLKSSAEWSDGIIIALPKNNLERYVRPTFTVGVADITAGLVTCGMVK